MPTPDWDTTPAPWYVYRIIAHIAYGLMPDDCSRLIGYITSDSERLAMLDEITEEIIILLMVDPSFNLLNIASTMV